MESVVIDCRRASTPSKLQKRSSKTPNQEIVDSNPQRKVIEATFVIEQEDVTTPWSSATSTDMLPSQTYIDRNINMILNENDASASEEDLGIRAETPPVFTRPLSRHILSSDVEWDSKNIIFPLGVDYTYNGKVQSPQTPRANSGPTDTSLLEIRRGSESPRKQSISYKLNDQMLQGILFYFYDYLKRSV